MKLCNAMTGVVLWACCAAVFPAVAAEVLYAPNDSAVALPSYQGTASGKRIMASPKFVDDADLNFDDIMLEDMEDVPDETVTKNETTVPPPAPADNIPLLQKSAEDSLPSQSVVKETETAPARPLDNPDKLGTPGKSLTETIKEKKEEAESSKPAEPENSSESTWINKLKAPLSAIGSSANGDAALEGLLDSSKRGRGRSNASVFDISGVMLRMSGQQVDEVMKKRGFQKVYQKFDIPNFIRWRNEETCRNHGVVGYERLESCVVEAAKQDKHQYVSLTKYSKFSTKEEIIVNFTSNFTNNKVYRVIYKSMSPTITGNSPKAMYLRNIKIYDFWKKVNQKYGAPDNRDDVTWGLGSNKPYMRAATGYLLLEDPMLRELDYTRMSREDQRYMNTDIYSF